MKTTGKVFFIIGILAFLGAVLGGNSVFGPCFFIALGAFLMHRANEKEEDKAKDTTKDRNRMKQPSEVMEKNHDKNNLKS